jgi:thiamine-monophosphate kinase
MSGLGEFELIARFFTRPTLERQGVGDDCALIDVDSQTLALTTDMLLEGVHFLPDVDPRSLGHKSLAVNLSDLAAAGARPRCFLLGLALPQADEEWLFGFSQGLFALAQRYECALVGGDMTRSVRIGDASGGVAISITAIGDVPRELCRGRSGANIGDDIWVSGRLGDAMLGLEIRRGELDLPEEQRAECFRRMDRPEPRIALGRELLGLASAAADISDGLLGDLGHILDRSGVGAEIDTAAVPRSDWTRGLDIATQRRLVLTGGDEYELVFTAPTMHRGAIAALATPEVPLTRIGRTEEATGMRLRGEDGKLIETTLRSFDHFAPRT